MFIFFNSTCTLKWTPTAREGTPLIYSFTKIFFCENHRKMIERKRQSQAATQWGWRTHLYPAVFTPPPPPPPPGPRNQEKDALSAMCAVLR